MAETRPADTWKTIGEAARKRLKELEQQKELQGQNNGKPSKQSKR